MTAPESPAATLRRAAANGDPEGAAEATAYAVRHALAVARAYLGEGQ